MRAAQDRHAARVRRLRINVAAWAVGTVALTALWGVNPCQATGALEGFGHVGDQGQWNPTLWAVGVGIWSLIVGIMALRVHFERPPAAAEVDVAAARAEGDRGARRIAFRRLEAARRIRFHVAAWAFGMIVATPLWALIEWQDNGDFERFSANSQPGSWEPWILYVGGIWAGSIAALAVWLHVAARRR
jgi:hypothetical protein